MGDMIYKSILLCIDLIILFFFRHIHASYCQIQWNVVNYGNVAILKRRSEISRTLISRLELDNFEIIMKALTSLNVQLFLNT